MHPPGLPDLIILLGVMVITAAASYALPTSWGWKAFPLVVVILTVVLLGIFFVIVSILYQNAGGGFVVHFSTLYVIVAAIVFKLTLSIRRRSQNL